MKPALWKLLIALVSLSGGYAQQVQFQPGVYSLPPTSIDKLNPHLSLEAVEEARSRGWAVTDRPGIGSGLFYLGNGKFVGLTDRGPNGDCPKGTTGIYFPLPSFAPTLVTFRLEEGSQTLKLEGAIPMRTPGGRLLSGLPARADQPPPYRDAQCTKPLERDPGGIDPEDVAALPQGGYLLVEENLPAVLYVDSQGVVRMGYGPEGVQVSPPYPYKAILPKVLGLRRENRGLENLAVSGDGRTAWAILQSPIGSTKDPAYESSLVARAVRLDVSNPLDAKVTGLYLVAFSNPQDYPEPNKPKDMKFSAATWVGGERILLLERAKSGARIFLVDFSRATNLLDHPQGQSPDLDKAGVDYASLGIRLPERRLILETWKVGGFDTDKLEGLALLEDGRTLAISEDNDFAITGQEAYSRLWLVRLDEALR